MASHSLATLFQLDLQLSFGLRGDRLQHAIRHLKCADLPSFGTSRVPLDLELLLEVLAQVLGQRSHQSVIDEHIHLAAVVVVVAER